MMKRNGKGRHFIYHTGKPLSHGNDQNLNFYHLPQFAAAVIRLTRRTHRVRLAGWARCSWCQMEQGLPRGQGCGALRRDVMPDGPAYFINLDLHHGFAFLPLSKGWVGLLGILSQLRVPCLTLCSPGPCSLWYLCVPGLDTSSPALGPSLA